MAKAAARAGHMPLLERIALPLAGFAVALLLWRCGVAALERTMPIATAFAPTRAAQALVLLLRGHDIWVHIGLSLRRVGVGLLLAMGAGVPLGLLVAVSPRFARAAMPLFQLLRMVSPLSWMPLAVMTFGVGDAPICFLLAFAAMWPILLNTAAGVARLDPNWLLLARSLSATRRETLCRVILPGIMADLLTGVRLAIGIIWIVLVPAEMLGVSGGLGYFILDTRDRLAYDELMAAIVLIGVLGYALDHLARMAYGRWLHLGR